MKRGIVLTLVLICCFSLGVVATAKTYGFGYQPSLGAAAAAVADKMGFFEEEGLNLKTRIFNDGTLINEALAANAIQFGVVGDMPTLTAITSGFPVTVVAGVGGGPKRERLMVADRKYQYLTDLIGKRIGLTRGTSGFNAFQVLCEQADLELSQFQIIHIRPGNMPEALATKQVDAVLTWEPTPSLIEAQGIGFEIANLDGSGYLFPLTLLVRNSVINQDPECIHKVLRALRRGAEFIHQHPEKTATIISEISGLDQETALKSLAFHYYDISWTEGVEASLVKTAEMLWKERQLRSLPDWEASINTSFCQSLK